MSAKTDILKDLQTLHDKYGGNSRLVTWPELMALREKHKDSLPAMTEAMLEWADKMDASREES